VPLGQPTAVIFKGKEETPSATIYHYRVEFKTTAIKFEIGFDKKTHLVGGIGLSQ
jgi:hypothetical protein